MPPATQASHWIAFLNAIAPICGYSIAAIALWVASRQSKTSREKLRLDLYDKRFAVYERTLAFYSALLGSLVQRAGTIRAFKTLAREANPNAVLESGWRLVSGRQAGLLARRAENRTGMY
jgi:hypothetical protein